MILGFGKSMLEMRKYEDSNVAAMVEAIEIGHLESPETVEEDEDSIRRVVSAFQTAFIEAKFCYCGFSVLLRKSRVPTNGSWRYGRNISSLTQTRLSTTDWN